MKITIKQIQHHRNGVCGAPFHVVLFTWVDGKELHSMVATVFDAPGACAVLDVPMLAAGNITFGENSWRGDHFEDALRAAISAKYEEAQP